MVKEKGPADASLYTRYRRQTANTNLAVNDKSIGRQLATRVSGVSVSPNGVIIPSMLRFRFGMSDVRNYVTNLLLSIASGTTRNLILNYQLSQSGSKGQVQLYRNAINSTTGGTLISTSAEANNVYPYYYYYANVVTDTTNPSNIVDTNNRIGMRFAGTYTAGYSGDSGDARNANLNQPSGIAFNSDYTKMYISDTGNHRIRQVDMTTNIITTIIGDGSVPSSGVDDNTQLATNTSGTSAKLQTPTRMIFDYPFLYVVNSGRYVRAYNIGSSASTTAGVSVNAGNIITIADCGAGAALYGITTDSSGNIYVANANNRIQKILKTNGSVSTVVGTGVGGFSPDGTSAASAQLRTPTGCDIDKVRNVLYISDRDNIIVRAVNLNASGSVTVAGVTIASGTIATVAGQANQNISGGATPVGDGGQATLAKLQGSIPTSGDIWTISIDPLGNIYIGDGNYLRRVSVDTGIIDGISGYSNVLIDNTLSVNRVSANTMQCAFGSDNSIYATSFGNRYIQRIY